MVFFVFRDYLYTLMNTKERHNFTLDKELYKEFNELSNKKSINKSKLIENFIREWVENNKDNERK